jgi:hypothetical protein
MLPLISQITFSLIAATFLVKLCFLLYYRLHKNSLLREHSLIFLFSKSSIKNSFYKPVAKYMRISNRITIVFYLLLAFLLGVKILSLFIVQ